VRDYGDWQQGLSVLNQNGSSSGNFFGFIEYTHGGGVDTPLEIAKNDGVSFVPHAGWHGKYEDASTLSGGAVANLNWPARQQDLYLAPDARLTPIPANKWYGSLLDGKTDATGFVYMRNRYYDPQAGRFTQSDPIGIGGGLNVYGYVGGDPVGQTDPFGLCCWEDAVIRTVMFVANMAVAHPDFIRLETSRNISEHSKQVIEAVKGLTENEESIEGSTGNILKAMEKTVSKGPRAIWTGTERATEKAIAAEAGAAVGAVGSVASKIVSGSLGLLIPSTMGDPEASAAWKKQHSSQLKKDP
jgi:RHS repeat-associated protein